MDERLAVGEAADVWRASRADGGLRVVLKRLLPPWTEKSNVRETFLEVIKDALPLRHPHLVPVLDFGESESYCYVVFEHVRGLPLLQMIKDKTQISSGEALRIATGVLRGLAFVHRAANPFTGGRLLHGDVSPQNILVDESGEARMVDLGFARVVLEAGLPGKPSKPIPRYVAPEVRGGQSIHVRSDVYGAGRILEDLMGAAGDDTVLRMAEVAAKACNEDPDVRYSDAGAMLEALSPVLPDPLKVEAETDEARVATDIPNVPTDPQSFLRRRYRILGELGRGGMGVVLKVRDRTLDDVLAIKVLPLERVQDAADLARFRRELTLARAVRHPNVARVDHLEEGPGFAYYTMEYVPGRTLEQVLAEDGRLESAFAFSMARQLTAGLAAVHAAGIIHRDLKPANIVVTPEGRVVLMDFGIACESEVPSGLTTEGTSLGTPLYMAPEQSIGQEVDARSDLFALGALLYEAVTGEPPFDGVTPVALYLAKRDKSYIRPRELVPELSRKLDLLIQDLLAPAPENRPPSAQSVLGRLD